MFSNTVLFAVAALLVGVVSEEKSVTKNGLTFKVNDDFNYTIFSANIPTLQEGAISDIDDMRGLSLMFDNINTIEPGAFQNLSKLRRLVINFNYIRRIEVGVFNNLNLTHLDIGYNTISFIASHAFDDMKILESIDISGNNLNRWDVLWFVRTPSLHTLHMSYNEFKKIPANAFGVREKAGTYYFIALRGNEINEIDDAAFEGFRKITVLFVDLTNPSALKGNFLRGIEIETLHINVDGIRCLPEEIFSKGFVPKKVTLNGNLVDNICNDRLS